VPSERFELDPIGTVSSPLGDLAEAPCQGDEGAPRATIVLEDRFHDALEGIEAGEELLVLTWLDRAGRDVLRVHPRGDTGRPAQGVFSTRSPARPNPIGLHRVRVAAIDGSPGNRRPRGRRRHPGARPEAGAEREGRGAMSGGVSS
jgi:tRNA-Thr(GGU) m(6)t(6)A37 methyltransferase TsaA